MINRVAVLGAGNGGYAFSGHLAIKGFEVRLLNIQNLKKVLKRLERYMA